MSSPGFVVCRGGIYPSRVHSGCRQLARSGQDRSLRTAAHGCFVGRGLDPSAEVCTCRTLPGRIWNPPLRVGVDARHRPGRLALPHAPRAAYMPPLRTFPEVCRGRIYASRQAPSHRKRPGRDKSLPYKSPSTPKRGPLFGGSRFGWYRKIIRKWLVYPRITRSCGICGRRS